MENHIDESWKAERPFEPSVPFDFGALETASEAKLDFANAVLRHPGDLEEALHEAAAPFLRKYGGTIVARFLGIVCNSRSPALTCHVLTYVAGLTSRTLQDIAIEAGVTKQAVAQMAEKLRDELNLPANSAQRSEEARESMAKAYRDRAREKY